MHLALLFSALLLCLPAPVRAQDQAATANIWGEPGLLTVPSARMYEPGTVVMHVGTLDPHLHGTFGLQLAAPLYVALRQTADTSSLRDEADRLYPGIDLRLRLLQEGAHVPEMTLGLRSAFGHKQTASEYLVMSKRVGDFDLTGGMAWSRMGSAGNLGNPLKIFGDHFGGDRPLGGEMPNNTDDWFTGNDAGLFAGIEYFPPGQPFSLKMDWNADNYVVEDARAGFDLPPRWSFGMAFRPASWLNFSVGMAGFEKILATLTLRPSLEKWKWRSAERKPAEQVNPYRTGMAQPGQMETSAAREDIALYHAESDDLRAGAMMELSQNGEPLPYQAGRAMRHMANNGGETVEKLSLIPTYMGLRGPEISLMRRDLEQALARQQGSPQEIWRHVSFDETTPARHAALPVAAAKRYRMIFDNHISLSEEDSGLLYRTGLVFEARRNIGRHFMLGGAARLNLKDNLAQLNLFRPRAILPVRSDVDVFAARRFAIERGFIGWLSTPKTGLHAGLAAGYLEEMYAGAGGEFLYRPFGKNFAVGADAWLAFKRDPWSDLNLNLNGDHLLTGNLKAWYEFPGENMTLRASIGRYLAEDVGGTLALEKEFPGGAKLGGFVTATNDADIDVFGGATHLYSGIKLSIPLGGLKYIPDGAEARMTAAPLGRDTGQSLDSPLPLYEMTEAFSMRHIAAHWNDVME
jgi:hypothetical protein